MTRDALDVVAFSHVGLIVKSIESFQRTWGALLGLDEWRVLDAEMPGGEIQLHGEVLPDAVVTRVACTRFRGTAIELLQPVAGTSATSDWLAEHGDGLQHLAFWVNDLAASLDRLDTEVDVTYSPASLHPRLAHRPVSATAVVTDPPAAAPFWTYAEPQGMKARWTVELLDVGFASDFRAYYGDNVFYPGDLPGT